MVERSEQKNQTGEIAAVFKKINKSFEENLCVTDSPWLNEFNFSYYRALIHKNKRNGKHYLTVLSGQISEQTLFIADYPQSDKEIDEARTMTLKKPLMEKIRIE